jgi:DNA-binding transcriptional MerR regulator
LAEKKNMSIGNNEINEYYTIGDVSKLIDVKQTVLRFWESEFNELKPQKNKFGHRVYTKSDIETAKKIKFLLYEERMSIEGAKKILSGEKHNYDLKAVKDKLKIILQKLREN